MIKKILNIPLNMSFPSALILGLLVGLGLFNIYVSNAVSYLSDDPRTCVNCHIMSPEFATWERGSHGKVASCNDCHVPQNNLFSKYYFKAADGLRHAAMFTFRMEPQVIRIRNDGKEAVQKNCIRCHSNYLHPISLRSVNSKGIQEDTEVLCWDCHRETPHGSVRSLTSAPYARVPQLSPVAPKWISNLLSKRKD